MNINIETWTNMLKAGVCPEVVYKQIDDHISDLERIKCEGYEKAVKDIKKFRVQIKKEK